jgi:hypothetical protein
MVAVFVDQIAQAPVVVQCAQNVPESWVKWLLQFILSTVPVAGGVGIAFWSFRATSKRDHERWILDQKMAEWSSLLRRVANVYQITCIANGWNRKIADRIVSELEPAFKEVSIAQANCVFLDKFRLNNEGGKKIMEFLRFATMQSQKLAGNLGLFDSINDRIERAGSATDNDSKGINRCIEVISSELSSLAEQSCNLLVWLQNEAAHDLGLTEEGEEHRTAMRWTKPINSTRKKTG